MNRRIHLVLSLLILGLALNLSAQGTAFNYQGQLNVAGAPANGRYDLRFAAYDAVTNGNRASVWLTNSAVAVSNGLFSATLDFGSGFFTGTHYWLDLAVRGEAETNFTTLQPRQPILPVPYAIFANSASNLLGAMSATQLTGTVPSSQISGTYASAVNFSSGSNTFAGTFSGYGAMLTNLNASQLASGTVADMRLSANVALLNKNQTNSGSNQFTGNNQFTGDNQFTGANQFTNWNNQFTGNFFGNGLVGWLTVTGTVQQASRDTGYMLINSNRTTVTLPLNANLVNGDIVRISGAGTGGWLVAQNTNQSILGQFFSPGNSSWVEATAASAGWVALASSSDGVNMIASAQGGGGIYISTDSGKTWGKSTGTFSPIAVASSSDGTKLFGAISGGTIVVSTNSGAAWKVSGAASMTWDGIASSSDGKRLVAVVYAAAGRIYTSTDTGTTWTLQNNSTAGLWYAAASSADGIKLVAAINGGRIYTSVNGGTNWTQQTGAPATNWVALASSADGTKLVAANYGGYLYTSIDSGVTWTRQTNAPAAYWSAVASSTDGNRLVAAATSGGSVYVSANAGLTWSQQGAGAQNWRAVTCSADGTKMAAGYSATTTSGSLYYWQAVSQLTKTTAGVNGSITGGQGSAVELQYIGNGQFMPVSSMGAFWAN